MNITGIQYDGIRAEIENVIHVRTNEEQQAINFFTTIGGKEVGPEGIIVTAMSDNSEGTNYDLACGISERLGVNVWPAYQKALIHFGIPSRVEADLYQWRLE